MTARGFDCGPFDPQRTIAAGLAWGAVMLVGTAAVIAGGLLGAAKWLDRP